MPSYGAEVRGGTANCMVVVADEPIASPVISTPSSLIVMNKASLDKFGQRLKKGGLLVFNSSLINEKINLKDGRQSLAVPADKIAVELGSPKSANMVALGAYLEKSGILKTQAACQGLSKVLAARYHKTLEINCKALLKGAEFARGGTS